MKDLNELTITEFLEELASAQPVPGGGSVAALAGALAAALTTMVARLTLGKQKFQDRWAVMDPVAKRAQEAMPVFQSLLQQDTEAYQAVVESFRLPKETEEEKKRRTDAIQKAFHEAARVPLETLRTLDRLMEDAVAAVHSGNPNAASDAGAAMQLIRAGAAIAAYNVWINLQSLKDDALRNEIRREVQSSLERIEAHAASCHEKLKTHLGS